MRGPRTVRVLGILMAAGLAAVAVAQPAATQEAPGRGSRLRVFLLCEGTSCDLDRYRSQVPWVGWVDSGPEADVMVSLTTRRQLSGLPGSCFGATLYWTGKRRDEP